MMNRSFTAAAALAGVVCAGCPTLTARGQGAPVSVRLVARGGGAQQAPGTEPGVTYRVFGDPPTIGPGGHVAFGADLLGPGVPLPDETESAVFAGGPETVGLLARSGAPAPGTGGAYDSEVPWRGTFGRPINTGGQVLFNAPLAGAAGAEGLLLGAPGGVVLVGRSNDPAPDAPPGVRFSATSPFLRQTHPGLALALNDSGQVAFSGALSDPQAAEVSMGLFAGAPGALRLVARTGSSAPGAGGAHFSAVTAPVLNGAGVVAFRGELAGSGINGMNNQGIWLGRPGALELAVRTGAAAPGTGASFTQLAPGGPAVSDTNGLAFRAHARDAAGVESQGIWAGGPASLSLVAMVGRPAPGTDRNFLQFPSEPAVNDRGEVAFSAIVAADGPTGGRYGIWAGLPGALRLVALDGEPAPLDPAAPQGRFAMGGTGWVVLNDAGHVAFSAGIQLNPNYGVSSLWATDPSGELRLIAREGGLLDVGGESQTIAILDTEGIGGDFHAPALGTSTGRALPFNDLGQLAFRALWDRPGTTRRDTGIFVATVPEPATAAVVLLASVVALLGRRCRVVT